MHELFKKCLEKAPYSPYRGSYFQGGGEEIRSGKRIQNLKEKERRGEEKREEKKKIEKKGSKILENKKFSMGKRI